MTATRRIAVPLALLVAVMTGCASQTPAAPASPAAAVSTSAASPSATANAIWETACQSPELIPGKAPSPTVGGMEGWFNATPASVNSCEEWPERMREHPDTVLINTYDNMLVEGYDRTRSVVMDPYRSLGDDFVVPDPDSDWPTDKLIVMDVRTGEVLEVFDLPDDAPANTDN